MSSFQENLLRRGIRRVEEHLRPNEERLTVLRNELAMYQTPQWHEFKTGLEDRMVELVWQMVDEDDASEVMALQRLVRHMSMSLRRPDEVTEEIHALASDIEDERVRAQAAAGLPTGATDAA